MMRMIIAPLALVLLATSVRAQSTFTLKPGLGRDTTEITCGTCHSLDYIAMNSPFLTEAGWKAEVTKMRTALGAPIDDDMANEIIQYLITHYGAPAP